MIFVIRKKILESETFLSNINKIIFKNFIFIKI